MQTTMRKLSILLLLAITQATGSYAQSAPVSTLSENFDVACITSSGMATDWFYYNPIPTTNPQGAWSCAPSVGRDASNCVICTGTYSGHYHVDTSYLLTPVLDITGYSDHVYLNFDTKTTALAPSGDTLAIELTNYIDSPMTDSASFINLSDSTTPLIGNSDVSGWVTHQIDITHYKIFSRFRIAFRYTSPNTSGNEWFLDNVNISTRSLASLHIVNLDQQDIRFRVVGLSTPDKIALAYSAAQTCEGYLALYDMMGREVYKENITLAAGQNTHTINDLGLVPGMYVIKLGNAVAYSVAKVMIQ